MNWETARNHIWTERRVSAAGSRLRVLVVDDNQNAADALAMYMHLEVLDIRTAYGGRQAVDVAITWTPHLILMDISTPGCTGFEAALVIRRDTKTSHIAIVAFTALDETEVRRHLMDHEFDAYCQKGQPPSELVALLKQLTVDPT